jgi:hypothetical protein
VTGLRDGACGDALRITAHTLAAAAPMAALSAALTVVAAAAVALGMLAPVAIRATATACLAGVLLLGALAQWLALRVRLDAALLRDVAATNERTADPWPAFDRVLRDLGLLPPHKAGHDELARCRGALRLARALGATLVAQLALYAIVLGDLFLHRTW